MRLPKRSTFIGFALLMLAMLLLTAHDQALAIQGRVIWSFGNGSDGFYPSTRLIGDANGNLYGTTSSGGIGGGGTAFELSPPSQSGGAWTESILWNFGTIVKDGTDPQGTLLMDGEGNLYGTTYIGGARGYGTAFELSPPSQSGDAWTESILWSFGSIFQDGANPVAGLIMDGEGNLYGTTKNGGGAHSFPFGTAFELKPPPAASGGSWRESILVSFNGSDGQAPQASLIIDKDGDLWGTTPYGGTGVGLGGTVFELTRTTPGGVTKINSISLLNTNLGTSPMGGLTINTNTGKLYGTSLGGGTFGLGTIFELSPPANSGGPWTGSIIWSFGAETSAGDSPTGNLIMDANGNLYGTTFYGGNTGNGPMFELSPPSLGGDAWTESILATFNADSPYPNPGLISGQNGSLYGTTYLGGTYDKGTVLVIPNIAAQ